MEFAPRISHPCGEEASRGPCAAPRMLLKTRDPGKADQSTCGWRGGRRQADGTFRRQVSTPFYKYPRVFLGSAVPLPDGRGSERGLALSGIRSETPAEADRRNPSGSST